MEDKDQPGIDDQPDAMTSLRTPPTGIGGAPESLRVFSEIRSTTAQARNDPNRMIEPRSPFASRCATAHSLTPASIGCFRVV